MDTENRFDELLSALANQYRRELLLALSRHNPQDDDDSDPLDIHDADRVPEFDIVFNHLPKLAELGIIEWDRETNQILKGPDWEEFEPLLRLIDEHREDLPDDWFK